MDRKKQLKEWYKNRKPDMGVFYIKSNFNNKCHLVATNDLKGTINGTKFRLDTNNYLYKELQKEWKENGGENFTIEILEQLKYDKDESKTDYSDELEILRLMWEEKLSNDGLVFYKKKA